MGLSFSQQISTDITNGYLQVINDVTASVTATLNVNSGSVNNLFISACDTKACGRPCSIGGNVTVGQSNSSTLQLSAITLQKVVTQVKTKIEAATTQYVKSLNQDQQSWLAFAFGINIQDQTTISNFSEKISNLISNTAATDCSTQIINSNTANIVLCNVGGSANVTQRNDVLAAESCVAKQIVTNIISNTELYNGMQFADQQNYFTPEGPFSFLYYIGLFILFIIIVVTIAGVIRYATRTPSRVVPIAPVVPPRTPPVPTVTPVA